MASLMSDNLETVLTLLNSAGVVSTLTTMLYLVLTGRLIPRSTLDEIITTVVKRVLDDLHT